MSVIQNIVNGGYKKIIDYMKDFGHLKKSIVAFLLKMLESPIFLKPSGLREVFMKSFHLFPCIISNLVSFLH